MTNVELCGATPPAALIQFEQDPASFVCVLPKGHEGQHQSRMQQPAEIDLDEGWIVAEVQEHIQCGASGTPHLEAVYHPEGHIVARKIRIRFPDSAWTGRHRA